MLLVLPSVAHGDSTDINLTAANRREKIAIEADVAAKWEEQSKDSNSAIWILQGNCSLSQGQAIVRGDEAVVWVERQGDFGNASYSVFAYVEGHVLKGDSVAQSSAAVAPPQRIQKSPPAQVNPRSPTESASPWSLRVYLRFCTRDSYSRTNDGRAAREAADLQKSAGAPLPDKRDRATQFTEYQPEQIPRPQLRLP